MKRTLSLLALGASALISMGAWAQADVSLWRIDCGTGAKPTPVNERFSDTFAFPGLNLTLCVGRRDVVCDRPDESRNRHIDSVAVRCVDPRMGLR
jgi:hypothetical protein